MAVLTAAAAMAIVTIEVEKRSPIMTPLCVAAGYCDELFFEHLRRRGLNQLYRSSARGKMLDWCVVVAHELSGLGSTRVVRFDDGLGLGLDEAVQGFSRDGGNRPKANGSHSSGVRPVATILEIIKRRPAGSAGPCD